jgi:hypothetical protein
MWVLLSFCLSSVPVQILQSGPLQQIYVGVRVGAHPGVLQTVPVEFDRVAYLQPVGQYESQFHQNGTDLLYVGKHLTRVPVSGNGTNALGVNGLLALSSVFGLCNDRLHLDPLPRKCKRGSEGTKACQLDQNCQVSFSSLQHRGTCGERLSIGSLSVVLPCDTYTVGGHTLPKTIPGPPQLSLAQLGAT